GGGTVAVIRGNTAVVDLAAGTATSDFGSVDTLMGIHRVAAVGGSFDTLIGDAAGSTLDVSQADRATAAYRLDDVTVDLCAGTATVNGSSVSYTLIGFTTAVELGRHEPL